jgi:hypothetical protein
MIQLTTRKIFIFSFLALFSTAVLKAQRATVTIDQDNRIERLLSLKKSLEKDNKLTDAYTIQLYYGELAAANAKERKYRSIYGNWPVSIEYETPNYKVWAGSFSSRLEADRALLEIKKNFPDAFILQPK